MSSRTISHNRYGWRNIPSLEVVRLLAIASDCFTSARYLQGKRLKVSVQIFIEEMYSEHREQAIEGEFSFVAIDENRQPTAIPE